MDSQVFEFANKLREYAQMLGPSGNLEWRYSEEAIAYPFAISEMESRAAAIAAGEASELIWFLEHPPLYTAGTSAKDADLLDAGPFPVFHTGRGGQYTYHGPGQLVAYVMLDLNRRERDVRLFVNRLEGWVIAALSEYGIGGHRREGHPGIWVGQKPGSTPTLSDEADALAAGNKSSAPCNEDASEGDHTSFETCLGPKKQTSVNCEAKIAAIGVRVRRWITYHGVAINIRPDLSHFRGIVPCGITDAGVTSLETLKLRAITR